MEVRNVIVIGGGPAGYTAAIYLARATLSPLVLAGENAGGQLMYTDEIENYPGFSKGIKGFELMEEMRKQAEKFGAEIKNVNVTKIDFSSEIKKVWVGETEYQAKAVILALGASAKMIGVGEEKYYGKGVSTCAVCDAAFYKDKTVFVVGGGDAAMEDALALSRFTDKVTIIHRRDSFRASKIMQDRVMSNKNIKVIWNSEVKEVRGGEKLEEIRINDEWVKADGLFLAIGHTPTTKLFEEKLAFNKAGYLMTGLTHDDLVPNEKIWLEEYPTMTSVAGVFGAGDMVDFRYRQAITAAGMGCMAALDVEKYLTGSVGNW